MKILVLCERVDAQGGTETYLRALLPALAARGHDVRVLARTTPYPQSYGVAAQALNWSDEHDPPSAPAAAAAAEFAAGFAPDVIAVHNILDSGVLDAMRSCGCRMIFHLHDHRPFCPNGDRLYPQGGGICRIAMSMQGCGWHSLIHGCAYGPRTRTLRLIGIRSQIARAVRASDATIAFSHYVARVATHNGVPSSKMRVLAPALEEAAFAAVPPPRPRSDAVLFAGRIVPSKGARSLVRALARIAAPNRPLLRIAGEGPDVQATRGEARALGVQLEVLGRLEPAVLRAAYDAATLVAMPSLWAEPFGLVGIEAFARGRPVVAYDAGAIAEWLGASAGAGHVVALGDEAGLASAISALLSSQWDHAAAQAFAAGSTYRLDRHVTSIEAVYRNE